MPLKGTLVGTSCSLKIFWYHVGTMWGVLFQCLSLTSNQGVELISTWSLWKIYLVVSNYFEFYDNCRNSRVFIGLFLLSISGQTLEFESARERALRQFVVEK